MLFRSRIERLNEFLDFSQGKETLDVFYQKFLKLLKYAPPGMTEEAKVARFVSKLASPLDTHIQTLRLTNFADILDAGRPVEQEIAKCSKDTKPQSKENPNHNSSNHKQGLDNFIRRPTPPSNLPFHLKEKAWQEHLCLKCLASNH